MHSIKYTCPGFRLCLSSIIHPRRRLLIRFRSTALLNPLRITIPTAGGPGSTARSVETQERRCSPRRRTPSFFADLIWLDFVNHRRSMPWLPVIPIARTQALSRDLPLSLLRFSILRPAFVLMRLRKPCSLFLFLTLGWYVRFNALSPGRIDPAIKQANYTERQLVVKERGAANGFIKGKIDSQLQSGCIARDPVSKNIFLFSQTYCMSRIQLL